MILYHFTEADLVAAIQAEGLKPGADSWRGWEEHLPPNVIKENVVWLTADVDLVFTLKRLLTCRLTVKVPSTDRRLVQFAKILRRAGATAERLNMVEEALKRCMAFYLYRGPIPPGLITAIDKITYAFPSR
jgi:hypothetical protein